MANHLSHKICLCPTPEQEEYFKQAAGTARKVWNWGLSEWNKQYAEGKKPSGFSLSKEFNTIKYDLYPWLKDIHRDAHSRPFANLQKAWNKFFADIKAKVRAFEPHLKKKGKCRDSFYVANDKVTIKDKILTLPKIGKVKMTEALRFKGKILGAVVSRTANKWFISIQVEVLDEDFYKEKDIHRDGVIGIDLGVKTALTLSTGESIDSPKPLKGALRRLKIRSRRISRKIEFQKKAKGWKRIPKGEHLIPSNNRKKAALRLAKLHARIVNIRRDFLHKMTTKLCRENQTIVIEDLNVKGMVKLKSLARPIQDIGLGEFRRQIEYKSLRYQNNLILADRWYPSSKLCSYCGWKNDELTLTDRYWMCRNCQIVHDRDVNASTNLKWLALSPRLRARYKCGTTVG